MVNTVSLNGTLDTHFAVSVLYKGGKITPYINGIALPSVTDTIYCQRLDGALHVGRDDLHQRDHVSARQLARVFIRLGTPSKYERLLCVVVVFHSNAMSDHVLSSRATGRRTCG